MITRTVSFAPSPEEMAKAFWGMGSGEQARFFNRLAEIADPTKFVFQLAYLTVECDLTQQARARMREIGEYAEVTSGERNG